VIGSRIGGSIGGFVELMNLRAEELGLESTHFADPNGLSYENKTTARELSLILQEALQHEDFLEAFTTSTYTVPKTNSNEQRELKSTDALTTRDSYYSQYGDFYYAPAIGGKTGFTRAAGYCLASVAEKDDLRVLAIVMGCPGPLTGDSEQP
jgi:D-alanyl-D-alanine carboxypeptidase